MTKKLIVTTPASYKMFKYNLNISFNMSRIRAGAYFFVSDKKYPDIELPRWMKTPIELEENIEF